MQALQKKISANFEAVARHIRKQGLGKDILARQIEARRVYERSVDQAVAVLSRLPAGRAANLLRSVQDARSVLASLKFSAEPQVHNAKPSIWKPAEPVTAPVAPADTQTPSLDLPVILAASPPPGGANLDPTIDVQITPEITAKSAELGGKPQAIYEFVRNQCEFQPYLGSRKGSVEALRQRAGNDYDLASLLIALLRSAGIPARYAGGIVEMPSDRAKSWLGVDNAQVAGSILTTTGMEGMSIYQGTPDNVVSIRCRRVWVEAYVPRGRGSATWVPLDPTFKLHQVQPGIDIPAEMGLNAQAFIDEYYAPTAPGVTLPRAQTPLELLKQQIGDYLTVHHPGQTLQTVQRSVAIASETLGQLAASLPYKILSRDQEYTEIPAAKRYQVRFHLYNGGTNLIDQTLNLPQVAGKRITIDYVAATPADQATIDSYGGIYQTPPYLVNLKPVLRVAGQDLATGAAGVGMGRVHSSDVHFLAPTGVGNQVPVINNDITCGASQAIGLAVEGVSEGLLVAPPADDTEGTAQLLYDTSMDYLARCHNADKDLGRLMHCFVTTDVADAIVENVVKVTYNGSGTPMTFNWVSMRVDADRSIVGIWPVDRYVTSDPETKDFMILGGAEGSAHENRIFEDSYGQDSVSTMKILQLASKGGITVYKRWNSTTLPANSLPSAARSAIQSAIAGGHVVTFPASQITAGTPATGQWTGAGWIDMDPATGAAGYIISGNNNGGVTVDWWPPEAIDLMEGDRHVTYVDVIIDDPDADSPSANAVFARSDDQYITFEYHVVAHYDDGSSARIPAAGFFSRTTHYTTKEFYPGHYQFKVWISRWFWWGSLGEAERKVSIVGVFIRGDDGTTMGKAPPTCLPAKLADGSSPEAKAMALVIPDDLAGSCAWTASAGVDVVSTSSKKTTIKAKESTPSAAVDAEKLDVTFTPSGATVCKTDEPLGLTIFTAEFDKSGTVKYGYDDYTSTVAEPKLDFISVKKSDSAAAMLKYTPAGVKPVMALVTRDNGTATAAPSMTGDSSQTVTLTGKTKDRASTYIDACFPDEKGAKIATLGVGVYKELSISKVTFYRVKDSKVSDTTPTENPTWDDLRNSMNATLQQGVVNVVMVDGDLDKDLRYDLNNNGCLDYYNDGTNPELDVIKGAGLSGDPKIALVRKFRDNWRIASAASAGQNKVTLVDASAIDTSSYTIGPASGAGETIEIVSKSGNELTLKTNLTGSYTSSETVYGWLAGLSSNPQIVAESSDPIAKVMTHEMLHTSKFGGLADVGDSDNIMYYQTGGSTLLRYRKVATVFTGTPNPTGSEEMQWDLIKR